MKEVGMINGQIDSALNRQGHMDLMMVMDAGFPCPDHVELIDIAFEAVGVESALDDAVQHIQKGGDIVVLGVFGDRPRVDMSVVGDRELSLIGTLMYQQNDYEQAVEWIADGSMITEPLVTKHFPFVEYEEAYRFIEKQADSTLKVVIDLD